MISWSNLLKYIKHMNIVGSSLIVNINSRMRQKQHNWHYSCLHQNYLVWILGTENQKQPQRHTKHKYSFDFVDSKWTKCVQHFYNSATFSKNNKHQKLQTLLYQVNTQLYAIFSGDSTHKQAANVILWNCTIFILLLIWIGDKWYIFNVDYNRK